MPRRNNGYSRKKRNTHDRIRKPMIFIGAEGNNKTEKLYFQAYGRQIEKKFNFDTTGFTDPEHMVGSLKNYMKENEFNSELGDKAYCLIDMDTDPSKNDQIAHADILASNNHIQVIASSPCFEVWYLCHHQCSTKLYNSNDEVIEDLEKLMPGYSKGKDDMFKITQDALQVAVKNAEYLEQECVKRRYKKHTVEFSPSTEIYKVIRETGGIKSS